MNKYYKYFELCNQKLISETKLKKSQNFLFNYEMNHIIVIFSILLAILFCSFLVIFMITSDSYVSKFISGSIILFVILMIFKANINYNKTKNRLIKIIKARKERLNKINADIQSLGFNIDFSEFKTDANTVFAFIGNSKTRRTAFETTLNSFLKLNNVVLDPLPFATKLKKANWLKNANNLHLINE